MTARLLRGLQRRLHRYHFRALADVSGRASNRVAGKDIAQEAREIADTELHWLREASVLRAKEIERHVKVPTTCKDVTLADWVLRRTRTDEPIAYLIGSQPFATLDIATRAPILIPRPETEEWTVRLAQKVKKEWQLRGSPANYRVLDLCTGSGCIGLTLASMLRRKTSELWPAIFVTCADISPESLALVRENIERNGLGQADIFVYQTDLFCDGHLETLVAQRGPFDLVVCNPPYISAKEYRDLDASVAHWEDRMALVGNDDGTVASNSILAGSWAADDGMSYYRRLTEVLRAITGTHNSSSVATRGATTSLVALEVGQGQSGPVRVLLSKQLELRASQTEIWSDAWDVERVVLAKL